ncbi:MAG: VCBS repeat-containing protein [Pyrinomonadaceae bacterium]
MKKIIALFCLLILSFNASAQTKIVPIVEMKVKGLLGGVLNGKFVDAKTTAAKLKGDENYTLFGIEGVNEGEFTVGKPTIGEDICTDFYNIEPSEEAVAGVALGDGFRWNPMPRAVKPIDLNDATYKKIVAEVLAAKRITKTTTKLKQAVRVDLDGDGQEEVLIAATKYSSGDVSSSAKVGDYSFILLRKIVAGKVQNIIIAGDFITKKVDFGAPNEYEISAIADLNGDGKMEIILHSAYYEGSSTGVYEIKGNKAVEVAALSAGCGV